ncbi:hypothetical protein CDIK_0114 [Cucumispora dikerogammari]|nr:hypothetical protein CDIK_0114 [Cucumispora dikerogammari]
MDELFTERKWYNIIEKLIQIYTENTFDENTSHYVNRLLPLIPNLNPQKLPELFKLYLNKTKVSIETKIDVIENIIKALQNPLEHTSEHENTILFFEILKTNYEMGIKDVQSKVYCFKEKSIFNNMNSDNIVKIELYELLLKYFEKAGNFNMASFYAKALGHYEKYIFLTLYSDELERVDVEINNKHFKEDYMRMFSGDFRHFKSKEQEVIKHKAMKYFILKKCYAADKINIEELAGEMKLSYVTVLGFIINLLTADKIQGFIDDKELIIHGTIGVSDLKNLKKQYEEWISRVQMVRSELNK